MNIRLIVPGDDRMAISRVYEESWRHAYQGVIPHAYLDAIPTGYWASAIDMPGRETLLLLDKENIVGVCSFGPSRFKKLVNWGEIFSIYLLPQYMGKGCGTQLLRSAIEELEKRSYKKLFLWVLEENKRARSFYERLGFYPSSDMMTNCIGGRTLRGIRYIYEQKTS